MNKVEAREAYFAEAPVAKYPFSICVCISLSRPPHLACFVSARRGTQRAAAYHTHTYVQDTDAWHSNYLVNSNYF